MNITTNRLTTAAGLCAAAAGAIFIGVQINHPPADVAHLVTTEMAGPRDREGRDGRPGAGRHHRHVPAPAPPVRRPRPRRLPVLTVGYLAHVRQPSASSPSSSRPSPHSNPGYVQDVLDAAIGGSPSGDIGHMQGCSSLTGVGYSLGGLLFGIALFRAGVLARWAAALLAVGTVSAARARRAAGVLQPPVRGARRRRADRPRRLPVARPAPTPAVDRRTRRPTASASRTPVGADERPASAGWPVPAGAGRAERRSR